MDIRKHENGWIYEINSPRWARGLVMTLKDAANRLLHYGGDASEIGVLVSLHNAHVDLPPRETPQNKQDAYGG